MKHGTSHNVLALMSMVALIDEVQVTNIQDIMHGDDHEHP